MEKTVENIQLRKALLSCLGHFPARVPLSSVFGLTEDMDTYTRTLVTYMVEPEERISAWLLYPKEKPPISGWPAILAIHQHAGQFHLGKSEPAGLTDNPMFQYGLDLCKRGYVVLCPDQLCFEDRRPSTESHSIEKTSNDNRCESFEFRKRLLYGSCLQTKYLHDLTCAVDLLIQLPDVNEKKIGVIGHSLGGQEALWLTWYDSRITVAASSCGFGLLTTILRDKINHNFAAYVPGMLELCDMDALVSALAPRPFLLTAGETDPLFPLDGVKALIANVRDTYAQADAHDRFQAILFPGGHSFPDEVKQEVYQFLDHWLK